MARAPTKHEKLMEDLPSMLEALNGVAEPHCAIIAGAFVENALMTLLANFLIEGSKIVEKMLKEDGALGTFSSCNDLAYCIGLISKSTYQNAGCIGSIRNAFAHSHVAIGFDDPNVVKLCRELPPTDFGSQPIPFAQDLTERILQWNKQTLRFRFCITTISVLQLILLQIGKIEHRKEYTD